MIQNGIVRLISNLDRRSSVSPMYFELKLLKLPQIVKYMTGSYVFRSLCRASSNEFTYRTYERQTRESYSNILDVPFTISTLVRQGIQYRGPTIFNAIPIEIRGSVCYNTFKVKFKKHLIEVEI